MTGIVPDRSLRVDVWKVREGILNCSDLERASSLWLINSLRGWVPVQLVERAGLAGSDCRKGVMEREARRGEEGEQGAEEGEMPRGQGREGPRGD